MTQRASTLADIRARRYSGQLDTGSFWRAVQDARDHDQWRKWGRTALLGLGIAHILAGIISFFAANWPIIPAFGKLSLIGAMIALTSLSAWRVGFDRAFGKALLITASTLIGVWLAVFGQIYQSGADNYELFLTWALLMAPWVLISRNATHWIFFLSVLISGLWLYTYQDLALRGIISVKTMTTAIIALQLGFIMLAEGLRARGQAWLSPTWARALLALSIAAHADYMAVRILISPGLGQYLMFPIPFISLAVLTWLYWPRERGLAPYTIAVIGWAVLLSATSAKLLSNVLDDWVFYVATAMIAVLATAASAAILNHKLKGLD